MAKAKYYRTPIVTAQYAYLTREDATYGGYKVTFELPKGHPHVQAIDSYAEDNFKPVEVKKPAFKRGYALNDAGMAVLKATTKYQPAITDSRGNPVKGVDIWSGSTGVVTYTIDESRKAGEPGVKLRLVSFQVGKLKTGGGAPDISGEVGEDAFVMGATSGRQTEEEPEDEVREDVSEDDVEIPF